MRGWLGEKIGEGVFADVPHLGARSGRQVVQARFPAVGRPARDASDPRGLRRQPPSAGGARRSHPGRPLRHRAAAVRWTDPDAGYAHRRITREQAGTILATLCLAVHKTRPPPDALSLREAMGARLRFAGSVLPERITTGVLALIEHLTPDDVLCYSDLHPGNVIMTAQGPRLIDWLGAARSPAAYEIAQCHVLLAELDPGHVDVPERATVNSVLQAEYARLRAPSQLFSATWIFS